MIRRLGVIADFMRYVSPGKARMYMMYGLDLVPGRRHGMYLFDINGKRYMNFHCNGGVFNLGHNNQEVRAVVSEALRHFDAGSTLAHAPLRATLAARLADLMPGGVARVLLCTSGSEANDAAIKAAMRFTGRTGVISANGAYHGGSGLAVAAGDPAFRAPFGPPFPGFTQVPFGDFDALSRAVDENTAAIILETIPATLGMVLPPDNYFPRVRQLCDERGVIMISDEVQTGLGRTGKLWGIDHWDTKPDAVVIGKGLSGGIYPMAAACFTPELAAALESLPFAHHSDSGGPDIGCAAALCVLETVSSPVFLNRVNERAALFAELFDVIIKKYSRHIVELRQKGLFMGVVFDSEAKCTLMVKSLFDNGIYAVYAGNDKRVLQFLPVLTITEDEAHAAMRVFEKALKNLDKIHFRILRAVLDRAAPKTV